MIKSLLVIAASCLIFSTTPFQKAEAASFSSDVVSITNTSFSVGDKITLSKNTNQELSFRWFVNDQDVSSYKDSYTLSPNDLESFVRVDTYSEGKQIDSDEIYFSTLPCAYIDTKNPEETISYNDYSEATMKILGNQEYGKQYDGKIQIKGRGTSSSMYDKKPFKIKLDEKTNLFGFGKSKHYVLLANYLDPSLLRYKIASDYAEKLGLAGSQSTWVNLVLNGEYVGNYLLAEHVRIGKQIIDIFDYEDEAHDIAETIAQKENLDEEKLKTALEENLSWATNGQFEFEGKTYFVSDSLGTFLENMENQKGGFLFELGTNNEQKPSYFTSGHGIKIAVSKPEYINSNERLFSKAKECYQDFEDAIFSEDGYNRSGTHYSELCDVDSLASYWLTNEIFSNEDAATRSRFCYVNDDGKIVFGPVWDFDISSASFRSYFLNPEAWNATGNIAAWYQKQEIFTPMLDDPYFQMKVFTIYHRYRSYLEKLFAEGGTVDNDLDYLYESGVKNEMKWCSALSYMTRSFSGEQGDVAIYKNFMKKRIAWLNEIFQSLDSFQKSLNFPLSNYHYQTSDQIQISADSALESSICDCKIPSDQPLRLKIKTVENSENIIYVNGMEYERFVASGGSSIETIPQELLDEDINVVSVIANQKFFNDITLEKNGLTICDEQASLSTCSHQLYKVEERKVSSTAYGLKESYYCSLCHRYFQDSQGKVELSKKEVITSNYTCLLPGSVIAYYGLAIVGVLLLLIALILLIVFLIKKRKRKLIVQSRHHVA